MIEEERKIVEGLISLLSIGDEIWIYPNHESNIGLIRNVINIDKDYVYTTAGYTLFRGINCLSKSNIMKKIEHTGEILGFSIDKKHRLIYRY